MSVFVGRLPPRGFYDEDLEDLFYKYGRIISCQVKKGARFAFGFVEFEDPKDAYYAIRETDGLNIDGVRIVVEEAKGEPRPRHDNRCYNCGEEGHIARHCRSYRSRGSYSPRDRYRSYSRSRSPYYRQYSRSYSRSPYSRPGYSHSKSPRREYSRSRSSHREYSRSRSPPKDAPVSVAQPTNSGTETQTTEQKDLVTQNPEVEQTSRPQETHAESVQTARSADEQVQQENQAAAQVEGPTEQETDEPQKANNQGETKQQ